MWLTIDLPYACFYIEVSNGLIVKAAPIGAWMVGKTVDEVERWVNKKGGIIKERDAERKKGQ